MTDSNAARITKTKNNRFTHTPKLTPFFSSFFLKPIRFFIVLIIAFTLTACGGGSDGGGGDGDGGGGASDNNSSVAVKASPIEAGDECPNGGISIDTGIDDNGNGVLDPEEVDETQVVCNGEDGKDGEDGSDGEDGLTTLISVSGEPAGLNCADGGIKIEVGLDDNSNGTLDPEEIDDTAYVCDGEDGTDGLNSLISISHEPAGDNCTNGGEKIEVGHDRNNNRVLDPEEVEDIRYVCNGENGEDGFTSLISISDEPSGDNCVNGGIKIESGLDDNRNGVLDPEEIIDDIQYVCNGQDGEDGLTSLVSLSDESSGDNCANGGVKIEAGLDDDGDGVLNPEEVDYTNYVCNGDTGLTTLVSITDEPAGTNCTNGGKKVEVGLDDNRNGVLDPAEVDNFWYVCNGEDGQDGGDGLRSLISITDEPSGDNCYYGGVMIEYGQDDNRNGVLDPEEVTDTQYVCNGSGTGDGLNSLVSITEELPGLNCESGGIKIDVGLDDNRNGTLDPEEIDDTAYVCDGVGGSGGGGPYFVGGTVSGLNGTVVLQNNGGDDLPISADGEFTFATELNSGVSYLVTVAEHPDNQTCTVVNSKGWIPGADVTGILVFCSVYTYTVGGDVSGLDSGNTVTLQNNGSDDLDVTVDTVDGGFTFATELAVRSTYNVTVSNHPVARTCEVTNGSGEISDVDVTDVVINCVPDVTAPTIELTFPMNGDTDIALDANVAATFSEPMDASTITTDTFTLYDVTASTSVNGTVSYDSNSNTAIFDPDDNLTIGHEYTATITTGTTDLAHNSLEDDYSWGFTSTIVDDETPVNTTGDDFINDGAVAAVSPTVTLSISATDNVGVTAYYVVENDTGIEPDEPDAEGTGWVAISPVTEYIGNVHHTFAGSHTNGDTLWIYVWFKDEAGNVSGVAGDSIDISADSTFVEGFEDGWGFWSADNGVWGIGTPTSGKCYEGDQCAVTVLDGDYPAYTDSRLISQSIRLPNVTGEDELHLRFWHWFSYSTRDSGQVQISVWDDTAETWKDRKTVGLSIAQTSLVWSRMDVNLTDYAGQKVRIAFYHVAGRDKDYAGRSIPSESTGWYIDAIEILTMVPEFTGDFEAGIGDWWMSRGIWEVGTPTAGPGECYEGGRCAGTVLNGNYAAYTDSRLISAPMWLPDVTGDEELHLRFWHWFSYSTRDSGQVQISVWDDTAETWLDRETVGPTISGTSYVWTQSGVRDITAYAGQKVRIDFYHVAGRDKDYAGRSIPSESTGWYVDDITITVFAP